VFDDVPVETQGHFEFPDALAEALLGFDCCLGENERERLPAFHDVVYFLEGGQRGRRQLHVWISQ
jgi:hypothetical protein